MKNKEIAKKDLTNRMNVLLSKAKLIPKMQIELEQIQFVLENFDGLDEKLFSEVPGYGLACDWLGKLQKCFQRR